MLPIDPIARVVVNAYRSTPASRSFDTGLLLVKDTAFTDEKRCRVYSSSAEALAGLAQDGFPSTSDAAKCAVKYFSASPAPARLVVSCYPGTGGSSETPLEALSALLAIRSDVYGVCFDQTLTNAEALALAAGLDGLSAPLIFFVPITGEPDATVAAGSLLKVLHDASAPRTVPFYCSAVSDIGALMGTAMGLQLSHPASAFSLGLKTIYGIAPSALTEAEVDALKALNCNVYVSRGTNYNLLEMGNLITGERYDERLYMDMIADDLQQSAVSLLADNPDKMPQTDDSTAAFINRFSSILMSYTTRQVLATSRWRGAAAGPLSPGDTVENGFALWAGSYDDQSDADRAAHKAVPIQVALTLAGSIESIVITVNVVM